MATVGERVSGVSVAEGLEAKKVPGGCGAGPGCKSLGSSARRGSARSIRSTGTCGRRRSRTRRGRAIFQQVDCEIPRAWSQLATNVVVSKYFYGEIDSGHGSRGGREYRSASWSTA